MDTHLAAQHPICDREAQLLQHPSRLVGVVAPQPQAYMAGLLRADDIGCCCRSTNGCCNLQQQCAKPVRCESADKAVDIRHSCRAATVWCSKPHAVCYRAWGWGRCH